MDDNTILPFVYEEVVCETDDPREAIPILWRILSDLDPDAAEAIHGQYRYAQRHGYDIEKPRVQLLLDRLFELLDRFATEYNAIFGGIAAEGADDQKARQYGFIQVNS